jgi:hypothetical protein
MFYLRLPDQQSHDQWQRQSKRQRSMLPGVYQGPTFPTRSFTLIRPTELNYQYLAVQYTLIHDFLLVYVTYFGVPPSPSPFSFPRTTSCFQRRSMVRCIASLTFLSSIEPQGQDTSRRHEQQQHHNIIASQRAPNTNMQV